MTLHFDATIGTVAPGIPFDSGVQFALGDTISGEFTFEAAEGDGSQSFSATQLYTFSLDINGVRLAAPSFEIEGIDDVLVISDFPPSGVLDQLILGANGLSPTENMQNSSIDPTNSGFAVRLYGPASILSQGAHPLANVWNDFDLLRQINVFFRNGLGGAVAFQATVGDFSLVPEPSFCGLLPLIAATLLCRYRQLRVGLHQRKWNAISKSETKN
jgi:hypothetical protein